MNDLIRPACTSDRLSILNVHRAAFGGEAEARLVADFLDGGHAVVSLLAEEKQQTVGHILFSPVTIHTSTGPIEALSLAPMAVRPEHQRRGIGSRLVAAGLAACGELGAKLVFVLGHPAFYRRFGFDAALASGVQSPFGGGEAWMALQLAPAAAERVEGHVEYAPPFQRLT